MTSDIIGHRVMTLAASECKGESSMNVKRSTQGLRYELDSALELGRGQHKEDRALVIISKVRKHCGCNLMTMD